MNIPVIILSLAFCLTVSAQDQPLSLLKKHHDNYVKYKIVINPMELLVQNISVTAEQVFYQHTLGITLAYKPAIQKRGEISTATGEFGEYKYDNAINHVYNAVSAGVNSKRYFHPQRRKNIYLDAQFLYRHWWFNDKDVSYPDVESYNFSGTRTEKMNVYDGKVLFGVSLMSKKHNRTKVVVDFFGGVDARYKTWQYQTYNGTVNGRYHAYLKEDGNSWIGNPYIGFQFGLGR